MKDRYNLIVFHYHFQTGGVSTVIRHALEAFRTHLPAIRSVELVAGFIPEAFASVCTSLGARCTLMPAVGYRRQDDDAKERNRRVTAEQAERLAEQLLRRFASDDSIWWIHNYHLGKNTVFTRALLRIAESGHPQRIILQIHDFPECGRFANLRLLKREVGLDPYPVSPRVRYAVLNARDRAVLIGAGVPERWVFLLENPVFGASHRNRRRATGASVKQALAAAYSGYDPELPLVLYPVRTIRRKNALEALLLCLLLEADANLLITLPGISQAERPYSEVVRGLFTKRICPGLWGIGSELDQSQLSFEDLVTASDAILSTSVQEGFGYLFINSLLWSRPLIARKLDTIEGLKALFADYPCRFYEKLNVPLSDTESLAAAYRRKILSLSDLIPETERRLLLDSVHALSRDNCVDFSYLPVSGQHRLLLSAAGEENSLLPALRAENRRLIEDFTRLLRSGRISAGASAQRVTERFGAEAYAEGFRRILCAFETQEAPPATPAPGAIAERVVKAFLRIENLRLLYDF